MEGMAKLPDNYYDLLVCDPPYFKGPEKKEYYHGAYKGSSGKYSPIESWEVPGWDYFNEVKRVAKKWIIWGCNYYEFGTAVPGRIIWDKCNSGSSFSDCETAMTNLIPEESSDPDEQAMAMTNIHSSTRLIRFMWNGMQQGKNFAEGHIMQGNKKLNEVRIHQTQKPVALYDWIFTNYLNDSKIVGDSHHGSGSFALSAMKFPQIEEIRCFELDPVIFKKSVDRIEESTMQMSFL